jgi:hypothetical protein
MSGLLWSALGGAIANGSNAFANAYIREAEEDRRRADEERREKRADDRDEAKFQRRKDAEEAERIKQAGIYDRAEKNAPALGDERRFEKFRKDARDAGYEADDATLREQFDKTYNQKVVAGSDRYLERYSKEREDVLNEVRRLGGSSDTIKQAQVAYDTARKIESDDARAAREERRLIQERQLAEDREDNRERRAERRDETIRRGQDIQRDRVYGGGSGGRGSDGGKPPTGVDLERSAKAAEKRLALELGVPLNRVQEEVTRRKKRGDMTSEQEEAYTDYQSALRKWREFKPGSGGSTDSPPTKPAGSKDRPPLSSFQLPTKN